MWFEKNRQMNRIERAINRIYFLVLLILLRDKGGKCKCSNAKKLNLSIQAVNVRSFNVAIAPVVLLDTEKVLISVAPKLKDGSDDNAVDVSFASSDASVGVEEQGDGRSAFILTPGLSGSAKITASAPGYADESIDVSYSQGAPAALNLSVGNPQPDA